LTGDTDSLITYPHQFSKCILFPQKRIPTFVCRLNNITPYMAIFKHHLRKVRADKVCSVTVRLELSITH
jgi:hypothetical protein